MASHPRAEAMASHPRAEALATISRDGVVPVFYNPDIKVAKEVARRLPAGGIHTIEFTDRGEGAVAVLAELTAWTRAELPELVVGVGSVTEATIGVAHGARTMSTLGDTPMMTKAEVLSAVTATGARVVR